MPWVDIVSRDDWSVLWYIVNSHNGHAAALPEDRPTFEGTGLNAYNLVAFDSRGAGRSRHRPTGLYDPWVMAADVAHFHSALRLPPVHVYAADSITSFCAMRFAALFPDMVLSLTLCHVQPPDVATTIMRTVLSDLYALKNSPPVEEWVAKPSWVAPLLGDDGGPGEALEMMIFWEKTYPPTKRAPLYESLSLLDNPLIPTSSVMSAITQPTLFIQGDWGEEADEFAQQLAGELENVKGGARIVSLQGARPVSNAPNKPFLAFLASQPTARHRPGPAAPPHARMRAALAKLGDWVADSTLASRDPYSPLSFSLVPPDAAHRRMDVVRGGPWAPDHILLPYAPDGRPFELFSSRIHALVALKAQAARAREAQDMNETDASVLNLQRITSNPDGNSKTRFRSGSAHTQRASPVPVVRRLLS